MVDLTSVWPSWGDTGSQPSDGTSHSPGDNPKAQSYNHLWYYIEDTFSTVETWMNNRESAITVSGSDATAQGKFTVSGDISDGSNVIYDSGNSHVNQARLENDSVTVAGNSVALGNSTGVSHGDLTGINEDTHHSKDHDHTESGISTVPNGGLTNDTVTVAGNSVALGNSTAVSHGDISSVSANQHHSEDHDHTSGSVSVVPNGGLDNDTVTVAGNSVSLGGSTSVTLGDLSNVTASGEGAGNNFDADTVDGQHASDVTDSTVVFSEGFAPNFGG